MRSEGRRAAAPPDERGAREDLEPGGVKRGMAHRSVLAVVLAATGCAAAPPPAPVYVTVEASPASPAAVAYAPPAPTFGYREPAPVVIVQTPPAYAEPTPRTVIVERPSRYFTPAPSGVYAAPGRREPAPMWAVAAPLSAHALPASAFVPRGRPIAVTPAPLPAHVAAPMRVVPPARVVGAAPPPRVVVEPRRVALPAVAHRQPPHFDLLVPVPLRPVQPSPRG
jgi:hypothetical protein